MSVTATNLIAGPGTLYTAPFASTEPLDTAITTAPTTPWVDAGGTQDGVKITINRDYMALEVDQIVDIPGRRLTKRDVQIKTNLAEATLANLVLSLAGGTITSGTGNASYEPANDTSATQATYSALIFDGYAPQSTAGATNTRRFIVRKVLSIENVETSYKKDDQTLFPITFGAHYVSSAVKPFRVVDAV